MYDRGVTEGRSNVKTISKASYERGLQDGRREAESKSENSEKVDVVAEVMFLTLKYLGNTQLNNLADVASC